MILLTCVLNICGDKGFHFHLADIDRLMCNVHAVSRLENIRYSKSSLVYFTQGLSGYSSESGQATNHHINIVLI